MTFLLPMINNSIRTFFLDSFIFIFIFLYSLFNKILVNKIPVIYSLGSSEGVAVRFRQQINENSKLLCWHHTLPEMNHNELVGWTHKNDELRNL